MPTVNKKRIRLPWEPERKPFEATKADNKTYNNSKWRKASEAFKASNPVCMMCHNAPSYTTDHIIPVKQGGSMWDRANWQALCYDCNFKKTGGQRTHKKGVGVQNP